VGFLGGPWVTACTVRRVLMKADVDLLRIDVNEGRGLRCEVQPAQRMRSDLTGGGSNGRKSPDDGFRISN
jgi:hypothetical protein